MAQGLRKGKQKLSLLALLACRLMQLVAPMSAMVGGSHARVASPLSKEVELMAKEPSDPSLFPWGFQRGQVPQASPEARLPPLRKRPSAKNTSGQGDGAKSADQ